jgi:fumarate reductase flavoprotein subunit
MPELVIIGGGGSGLSAAIEAATTGGLDPAEILVVDSEPTLGGAAVLAGGGMCLAATPLQRERGIEDSVDLAYADWLTMGGDLVDKAWAHRYLSDSTELYEWLASLGLVWQDVQLREGNTVPRWHRTVGGGKAVAAALTARVHELGIRTMLGTEVTGIRPGSVATTAGDIPCAAAVVATGGFVNDEAMVRESAGLADESRFLSGGAAHADGRGHRMLAALGAEFTALGEVWFYPFGTPNYRLGEGLRGLAVRGLTNMIWVNQQGERFHDESLSGGGSGGRMILRQPGQTCWVLFDADELPGLLLRGDRYYGFGDDIDRTHIAEFLRDSPYAASGDSIGAAAANAGLPADAVAATVHRFNAEIMLGGGRDASFGRSLAGLRPIATGPFYVLQFFPLAQKCLGGVHTDEDCVVRRPDGSTIDGVFASGEVAGMGGGHINGHGAIEGTMLGPSLHSGRIAGAAAAAYVQR